MDLLSQQPKLSTDPCTKGFDISSGNQWIYPENYPVRKYQFTIVKTCLFHNTLVCLPTGLGKTFIAAVVMYNYWRWYPRGIIVFLAPTKPLVAQQINACHNIMGIPISETIELTGTTNQKQRGIAWRNKRVIFATPQTFQKDLEKGIIPEDLIKCVVIDEAHKALGKHSYCESVRALNETNKFYRLVALSATPGGKLDAVQEVIRNLGITRLELRDDTSPDITPYINEKKMEIIPVGLGDNIVKFHDRYITIMDPYVRILVTNNVLRGSTRNLSKNRIFMLKKELSSRQKKGANIGVIMKALTVLMTMCHANELMLNHGLRAFSNFYQNHSDKFWMNNEPDLLTLLDEIKLFIGSFPDVSALMNGSLTEIPDDIVISHAKFEKLQEIVTNHFKNAQSKNIDTRAIVFVEYRDIVNEVYVLLLKLKPLVRPQVFMGQAGLKQKQQKKALEDFKSNHVNILISTSVGEEGIDVGEVDLIICFDIRQHSPTRLVQRMGRTGRKRDGHIIVLVTDGQEHQTLKTALARRDSLNKKVLQSSGVTSALGVNSPRMVPADVNPDCKKMHITVIPSSPGTNKKRKRLEYKAPKSEKNKHSLDLKPTKKTTNKNNYLKNAQYGMIQFLAQKSNENDIIDDPDMVPMRVEENRMSQLKSFPGSKITPIKIKPSDVKLLISDNQSLDFLTLYTIEKSAKDVNKNASLLNISYGCMWEFDKTPPHFKINVPPLSLLDCISQLKEYVTPIQEEELNDQDNYFDAIEIGHWDQPCIENDMSIDNPLPDRTIFTEGRFEDILDESSIDSVDTIFFSDIPPNEVNDLNISKENDIVKAVVIGGGFEKFLDDESDDDDIFETPIMSSSELEIADTEHWNKNSTNRMKSQTDKVDIVLLNRRTNLNSEDCGNISSNITRESYLNDRHIKEVGAVEENTINKRRSDVPSGSNMEVDHKKSSYVGETSKSVQKSITNLDFKKMDTPSCSKNNSHLLGVQFDRSPDLSKSQRRARSRLKLNMSTNISVSSPIIQNSNILSDDNEMFNVSLSMDSDFEQKIVALENSNASASMNKMIQMPTYDCLECNNSAQNYAHNAKHSQFSPQNHVQNNDMQLEIPDVNDLVGNIDADEWNSDLDISLEPITESKYFSNNLNLSTLKFVPSVNNSTKLHKFQLKSTCQKENEPLLKALVNNSYQDQSTSKKLSNVRKNIFAKVKSNVGRVDFDSDDEAFASAKVIKPVFQGIEKNIPDFFEPSLGNPFRVKEDRLALPKSNGAQKLPEKSRTITFVESSSKSFSSTTKAYLPSPKKKISSFIVSPKKSGDTFPKKIHKSKKRHKKRIDFIDDEAEVSADEYISLGSSEENEEDNDLDGFVAYSQHHDSYVDMRAHYLQSVRSPRRAGQFLIKKPKTSPRNLHIYSQAPPHDEPDTYLCDSFCVMSDEETPEESLDESTLLEKAERKLKKNKRKRRNSENNLEGKRRRIVNKISQDSSSEDETERMRAQIVEESMLLKR